MSIEADIAALTTLSELLTDPPAHIRATDAALERVYGMPVLRPDQDPLGGLIATVLSQHTSDLNSGRAFASLRLRFPTWEAVRRARREDLADAIRSGGIAEMKSARIQAILDTLAERYGRLGLDWLQGLAVAEARAALTALHGVGPKTASCVLLFNLGMPAFPVDTHVYRVSLRLGYAHPKASPARVQDLVEAAIAPGRAYPFHVNLIRHGRQVCKAQRPRCAACPLRPLCRYGTESAFLAGEHDHNGRAVIRSPGG